MPLFRRAIPTPPQVLPLEVYLERQRTKKKGSPCLWRKYRIKNYPLAREEFINENQNRVQVTRDANGRIVTVKEFSPKKPRHTPAFDSRYALPLDHRLRVERGAAYYTVSYQSCEPSTEGLGTAFLEEFRVFLENDTLIVLDECFLIGGEMRDLVIYNDYMKEAAWD